MVQLYLVKHFFKAQFPRISIAYHQPRHVLWDNGNFRLFLTSECAGIFGNHFYQLALPLLVKEFTGSAGAMSIAIVLSGISRFAFMMVGGTLSDRFSPRQLILAAGIIRAVLLVVITTLALAGQMNIVALYGFSFASGITDAIFVPARGSVMPLLVEQELLKGANAIASAQEKLMGLFGPVMAGLVISWMSQTAAPASSKPISFQGPVAAFLIDILAIVISILILRPVKFANPRTGITVEAPDQPDVQSIHIEQGSIRDVVRLIRDKASLRVSFLMVYAINCISSGPLYIGMPMLVVSRFPEGAQALGFMTSAIGGGALIGTLLAGLLPQPKPHRMVRLFLTVVAGLVAGLAILLSTVSVSVDALAVLIIAALISYINITGLVQIQKDTPPAFMGRMMGLLNLK
jgi:MFS family permease